MKEIKIAPSMLSSDFSRLCEELKKIEAAGADLVHLDVMDGHFVPNLTFGAPIIKALRPCTTLTFDVHLMITDPLKYVGDFIKSGADLITFHVESDSPVEQTIDEIRRGGCTAALSVKPATPIETVFPYLEKLGLVLIMTVEPGFGGQAFMSDMIPKIQALREECNRRKLEIDIQVDGGISAATVSQVAAAGANVYVAGSSVFGAPDTAVAISAIRKAAQKHYTA